MYYQITPLTPELVFIKWYRLAKPGTIPEKNFVEDLRARLENASGKLYFISDLRDGRIMDVRLLQQLSGLVKAPNWGDGTAFANDPISKMFANVFARFAEKIHLRREIWDSPEEAIAYLESVKPGITAGIDWRQLLENDNSTVS